LNVDQTSISGWGELTARFAEDLTDECIGLLVEDMRGDHPAFHGVALGNLPAERIVPRMLPLLKEGTNTARFASYVLAVKRHASSLDTLIDWLDLENFRQWSVPRLYGKYLPLFAARFFPHEKLLTLVREYADPNCELHKFELEGNARGYRYYAQYILDLNSVAEFSVPWMMNKYFKRVITEIRDCRHNGSPRDGTIRLCEPVNAYWGLWDRQLLISATQQVREQLATEQKESLLRMLHQNSLGYDQVGNGRECDFWPHWEPLPDEGQELYPGYSSHYGRSGLRIIYDEEDYVRAATDWILRPELHIGYFDTEKPVLVVLQNK
jgi:hypothetical protein